MSSQRHATVLEWTGWGLAAVALGALGAVWHFDRARVWEVPSWDDAGLVELASAERAGPPHRSRGAATARGAGEAIEAEAAHGTKPVGESAQAETWAVAVNPGCALCRGSLERAQAVRRLVRSPVRLAVLVVDSPHRPHSATVASLPADELRWDSTGAWRRRWGHRVYGELLCFDRAGRLVRTLAPLADSIATGRALRLAGSLRKEEGS